MILKKTSSFLLLILISLGLLITNDVYAKTEDGIKKLDRIIAVVDQDVITEKELQEKIAAMEKEI